MMTQEHRAALREAASKATPGPWEVQPACARFDSSVPVVMQDNDGFSIAEMCRGIAGEPEEDNAAYIALAHPAAVLALLDECDALRAALDAAEAARQSDADFWQQEIARMADPVGYARGVRDAAALMHPMLRSMLSRGEAHAAILALLPANKEKNDGA